MYPQVKAITEDYTSIVSQNQAINAFYAGHFERGPVGELTQISSIYDFKITFGKPTSANQSEWFQIYNYFLYNNNCIYIVRTGAKESSRARRGDISAKYPGEYGNSLRVVCDGSQVHTFLNNKLVETIAIGESSYYIDYPDTITECNAQLTGGFHAEPTAQDIADAYEIGNSGDIDYDFILANPLYEEPALQLAEAKLAIAFTYKPHNTNCICYNGSKRQNSIFTGKTIEVPILGDALGMRCNLANTEGLSESHCKRSYKLNSIESAKILDLKELYDKRINSIAKDEGGYYFYSETLGNGNTLTQELILNRLKKESSEFARYFVFELNDELTRNEFQKKISAVCQNYKDNRYITDYLVVCNDSNQLIEPNSMICDISVKMAGIIEVVNIRLKAVSEI